MKTSFILGVILLVAITTRFLYFKDSTYFGYDEARDAYTSLAIYQTGDFKLIGPPANFPGLFHGPLYWYLLGPIYLLGHGSPYFASAVFRLINSLGILAVFAVASKLFNKRVGIISAFIFAFSFEETQYAMFVSNPSLAIFAWMAVFFGLAILVRDKNPKGLLLIFAGAAVATQLELIYLYTFALIFISLLLLKNHLPHLSKHVLIKTSLITLVILSTFIVAELKYNFQSSRALIHLFSSGYHVMQSTDSPLTLYLRMFLKLFQYNILNLPHTYLAPLVILIISFLLHQSRKNVSVKIILVWILASTILLPLGGYDALYVNLGIGIGIIIAVGYLTSLIWNKNKYLTFAILLIIGCSNLTQIIKYNPKGLIVELKPQPFMQLTEEIAIMDKIYTDSEDKEFTVRVTGIPYGIQTTWAYLLNYYGKPKWDYLPYWEGQMVAGFPGDLPLPQKGTTCLRFLIIDPTRGLPINLIEKDILEENHFSEIIDEERYGEFTLQIRQAKDKACRNQKEI